MEEVTKKSKRGFASMDPEKQRAIASRGGKAAHVIGTAHKFTSEEAREAGRKGGRSVSRDRDHMAALGRKGGAAKYANQKEQLRLEEILDKQLAALPAEVS